MELFLLLLFAISAAIASLIYFIRFLFNAPPAEDSAFFRILQIAIVVIYPAIFLIFFDFGKINDCCSDSAVFSPGHRGIIYTLILLSMIAYIVSVFRKKLFPPFPELLLNLVLIIGLVINILLCFHLNTNEFGPLFWVTGNVPNIFIFIMKLAHHQKKVSMEMEGEVAEDGFIGGLSFIVLKFNPLIKYPILLVLCVPLLILLSLCLFVFGQKPDSIIRAFTDTYKHGFSQLDYQCQNVECGGHFLCSVGANGHPSVVKPIRYGERNRAKIICTRQLLISNAFEELIQEKFPSVHKVIRTKYNSVGNLIHRYYHIFQVKLVSDVVYVFMKPLEWFFLVVLYSFDQHPENRIARQYLSRQDRNNIEQLIKDN